ncbi:hypothetical protein [Tuwongella immobilis]|uniref:: SHOCT n=1 Tax=Tuwongella immobilis TaxID=692036 RepID=A0A6C2YMN6_9BACT|nr:hypothetical protein [Tuwongella immobilis]VIP02634.1 : SHOCT [Tuwongella immobilis]VTS01990.1 : SHOCT [Tuwongella immobilis]
MILANILQNQNFLAAAGLLILTLLLGAGILTWLDRWKKRQLSDQPNESLGSYRKLYENGELTREEYEAIRARVAHRVVGKTPPASGKRPGAPGDPSPASQPQPPRELPKEDPSSILEIEPDLDPPDATK